VRHHRPGFNLLAALAIVAAMTSCSGGDRDRTNVVILTLDTTRADRFGCYGFDDAHTPRMDAFAADQAVLFEQSISPVPITLPSHASIFTGTYPVFHGVHDNDGFYVDDELTTLAEILSDEGYRTGAVIGAFPVDSQFNLDQGFETYNDAYQEDWTQSEIEERTALSFGFIERKAHRVNSAAFRWLDEHDAEPFLLWMHYFDPHQPYGALPPYDTMFADGYDGEIAFVDECFGELLDELERRGLIDSTVILVVGDHGESLDEHGEPTHATFVYDATQRVPLLIAAPGRDDIARGGRVKSQVRTIDVAPTVLELLDLPAHPEMQGVSLVPALKDPSVDLNLPAMLESHFSQYHFKWAPLRGLRTHHFKYILAPRPELYDLQADPGELYNLASTRPDLVAEMDLQLEDLVANVRSPKIDRSAASSIDSDTRAKLEALGYLVGGGAADRVRDFPSRAELATMPNPIDGTLALHYVNASSEMLRTGNLDVALDVVRRGLEVDPANYRLQYLLGQSYLLLGKLEKALNEFNRAAEINPSDSAAHSMIGQALYRTGRFEDAVAALETATRLEPNRADALEILGLAHARLGNLPEAIQSLQQAVHHNDGRWQALLRLGLVQAEADELEEARQSFQRALHLAPYSPEVLDTIGLFYLSVGNPSFARQSFAQALRVQPTNPAIRYHLAEAIIAGDGGLDQARPHLEQIIDEAPDSDWAERARAALAQE